MIRFHGLGLQALTIKKALLSGILLSFSLNGAHASTVIEKIVKQYYSEAKLSRALTIKYDPCTPPRTSCFRTACDLVDRFECDEMSEQNNIRNACSGVWGGECITNATQFLGKFEYDENEEMTQLVGSCRGVYDLECVRYSCTRLGRFGCDDLEEIIQVNSTCGYRHPINQ